MLVLINITKRVEVNNSILCKNIIVRLKMNSTTRRRYDPDYYRYHDTIRIAKRPREAYQNRNGSILKKFWVQCYISFFIFLTFLITSNLNFKVSSDMLNAVRYTLSYSVDFGESMQKAYSVFSVIKQNGGFNFFYNKSDGTQNTQSDKGNLDNSGSII